MSSTTHTICDICGFDPNDRGKRLREFESIRIEGLYQDVCSVCWKRAVHALKNKPDAPTPEEIAAAVAEATEPLSAAVSRLQDENQKWAAEVQALRNRNRELLEAAASDEQDEREFGERLRAIIVHLGHPSPDSFADLLGVLERAAVTLKDTALSAAHRAETLDRALAEERKNLKSTMDAFNLVRDQRDEALTTRTEVLRLATVLAGMIGKKSRARNADRIAEVERQLTILTGRTP